MGARIRRAVDLQAEKIQKWRQFVWDGFAEHVLIWLPWCSTTPHRSCIIFLIWANPSGNLRTCPTKEFLQVRYRHSAFIFVWIDSNMPQLIPSTHALLSSRVPLPALCCSCSHPYTSCWAAMWHSVQLIYPITQFALFVDSIYLVRSYIIFIYNNFLCIKYF